MNLLPPSPAIAGIFTIVGNTRGVWKSPAIVSFSGVVKPSVNITNTEQEELSICSEIKFTE